MELEWISHCIETGRIWNQELSFCNKEHFSVFDLLYIFKVDHSLYLYIFEKCKKGGMEYGDKGNNISDGGGVCLRGRRKKS